MAEAAKAANDTPINSIEADQLPNVEVTFAQDALADGGVFGSGLGFEAPQEETQKDDTAPGGNADAKPQTDPAVLRDLDEARRIARERDEALATERAQRIASEKTALTAQIAFAQTEIKNIDNQAKELRRELAKADEEGETEKKIEIQSKLDELLADKPRLTAAITTLRTKEAELVYTDPKKTAPKAGEEGWDRSKEPAVKDFLARNKWFTEPKNKDEVYKRHVATQVDKEWLDGKKYDPRSSEFYIELEKEVEKRMQQENGGAGDGNNGNGQRPRSPVGAVDNSQRPSGGKDETGKQGTKVTLTRADAEVMRALKLNPHNQEQVREFAAQKLHVHRNWDARENN